MRKLVLALCLSACATAAPPPPNPAYDAWAQRHPQAAQELYVWQQQHVRAANQLYEFQLRHPDRAYEFVSWSIAHPYENIDSFVVSHPGWNGFDRMMEKHRPAAETFMAWCRRYPPAAQEWVSLR